MGKERSHLSRFLSGGRQVSLHATQSHNPLKDFSGMGWTQPVAQQFGRGNAAPLLILHQIVSLPVLENVPREIPKEAIGNHLHLFAG